LAAVLTDAVLAVGLALLSVTNLLGVTIENLPNSVVARSLLDHIRDVSRMLVSTAELTANLTLITGEACFVDELAQSLNLVSFLRERFATGALVSHGVVLHNV
jgi:hypothetical protein